MPPCRCLLRCDVFDDAERVHPDPKQSTSIVQDLEGFVATGPWWALFMLALLTFVNLSLRAARRCTISTISSTASALYRGSTIGKAGLLGGELFTMQTIHIIFVGSTAWGFATTLIGVIMSKRLATRFGKRNVFIVGLFLSACFILAVCIHSRPTPCLGSWRVQVLYNLSYGPTIPLLVGDDGRRGGLLGMANGPAGDGHGLRHDDVRINTGLAIGRGLTAGCSAGTASSRSSPSSRSGRCRDRVDV